jgi:hypothetical protein
MFLNSDNQNIKTLINMLIDRISVSLGLSQEEIGQDVTNSVYKELTKQFLKAQQKANMTEKDFCDKLNQVSETILQSEEKKNQVLNSLLSVVIPDLLSNLKQNTSQQ